MRRAQRLVALAGAVAMAVPVTGSAAFAAPGAPDAGTARITWAACTDPDLAKAGAQCGMLAVPLDYDHPNGTKIQLAVSRIRHTVPDAAYQGIMLVNPGGPGGSGLGLATLGASVPKGAGDAYDWIGFDPRGVGASVPSLSCDPSYFSGDRPDYVPRTAALEHTWLNRSKGYAAACGKFGALLDHLTTVDAAKDLDRIRAALGRRQLNYYGFSYGTYLAQVYATLFPKRIRRMVLDSNVDPRRVFYQANLDQDVAFERNVKIWFGWVARFDSVYHLGTTEAAVEKLWYQEKDALARHPAGGVVGPDEWTDIFLFAGYAQFLWTDLGSAFAGWVHTRDPKPLIDEYVASDGPGDDNGFAVYNAVQCTDAPWPGLAQTIHDNWEVYRRAPFETWGNAWYNAPCLSWPGRSHQPVRVDGSGVGGILLIDETLDAATPFQGSLEVRRRFPHASLLAEPGGTTHANSLAGNACVDDQVADYLATGKLAPRRHGDRADTFCAPLPQPDPTAARAAAPAAPAAPRPVERLRR
jgi:pimeloyl-ACP methyl ester carboxylesterase